jgi:hypothetical protein
MKKIENGKVLIIPDVHQDIDFVRTALQETYDHVVFIGDWFDTLRDDVFGFEETVNAVNSIFDMLGDKATWLPGNHDIAYIASYNKNFTKARPNENYLCSGVTRSKVKKFSKHINPKWFNVQELAVHVGDFVISHAGFNLKSFAPYGQDGLMPTELGQISNMVKVWEETRLEFQHMTHWIWMVGYSRGGPFEYGSPVWQDWNQEFVPLDDVGQIVGHTCQDGFHNIRMKHFNGHKNYCIDTNQKAYAIWDDNKLTFRSMEDGKYYEDNNGILERIKYG